MNPPQLTEAEAEAVQIFFRHVWLGYDDKAQPIHSLLRRIDLYLTARAEGAR